MDEVSESPDPVEPDRPSTESVPTDAPAAASESGELPTPETGTTAEEKPPPAEKKWRREPGLALSFRKGLPVEGKIEQVIRGGYEVRVGNARGFCPHSQMDLQHVDTPEAHVGRVYPFRVIQIRRGGEEVVLSRRALLEESRSEEAKAVRATLLEGQITQGRVARLADFGAFVDLGAGVTGLVHVSEISRNRINRPADVLNPGDVVRVKVLSLATATGRISLSIRQATEDPWKHVAERYHEGEVHPGTVQRVVDFGAFVELEDGLEALAPADAFAPGPDGWRAGIAPGQKGSWRIVSLDLPRHRISLVPVIEGESAEQPPLVPGAKVRGRVQRVENFGVFVWLRPGLVGLMPNIYTGTKKGSDLSRAFSVGSEIEVEVVEVDAELRRVRLAVPGAATAPAQSSEQRKPQQAPPRDRPKPAPRQQNRPEPAVAGPAFGTNLGDALRAAYGRKPDES